MTKKKAAIIGGLISLVLACDGPTQREPENPVAKINLTYDEPRMVKLFKESGDTFIQLAYEPNLQNIVIPYEVRVVVEETNSGTVPFEMVHRGTIDFHEGKYLTPPNHVKIVQNLLITLGVFQLQPNYLGDDEVLVNGATRAKIVYMLDPDNVIPETNEDDNEFDLEIIERVVKKK